MMPREDCVRPDGGAPVDPSAPACRTGSSGSGYWHSSRSIWGSSSGASDSGRSSFVSTATSSSAPSASTTHGGFGSFAHAIAAHIGG
jgi:hypothetical protein